MSDVRVCPDGHQCDNGSLCRENPNQEGSYYCDCSTSTLGTYGGLRCEFKAGCEVIDEDDPSESWWCTNGGECISDFRNNHVDSRCVCRSEYEGPHCEYIAGSKPDNWPSGVESPIPSGGSGGGGSSGLETGVMVGIIMVAVAVVGMAIYFILNNRDSGESSPPDENRGRRQAGQNAAKDPSEALNIDMDGSGFRDVVRKKDFDFDTRVEVDSESGSAPAKAANSNGKGNGVGHGMML